MSGLKHRSDDEIRKEMADCRNGEVIQVRVSGKEWYATLEEVLQLRRDLKAARAEIAEKSRLIAEVYGRQNG